MTSSRQPKARQNGGRRGRVFVAGDIRRDRVDANLVAAALVMIAEDLAAERQQEQAGRVTEEEQPHRTEE
jgi:hypothetical protein